MTKLNIYSSIRSLFINFSLQRFSYGTFERWDQTLLEKPQTRLGGVFSQVALVLEDTIPIAQKLANTILQGALKSNVGVKEARAHEANQVTKGILKGEIDQYLEEIKVAVKD